jgi:hypothetical protein
MSPYCYGSWQDPPFCVVKNNVGRANILMLLRRWAAQMQGQPIEGGGFRGRSNKLVDGCYSWWNGGLFTIVSALTGQSVEEAIHRLDWREESDSEWEDEGDHGSRGRVCITARLTLKIIRYPRDAVRPRWGNRRDQGSTGMNLLIHGCFRCTAGIHSDRRPGTSRRVTGQAGKVRAKCHSRVAWLFC